MPSACPRASPRRARLVGRVRTLSSRVGPLTPRAKGFGPTAQSPAATVTPSDVRAHASTTIPRASTSSPRRRRPSARCAARPRPRRRRGRPAAGCRRPARPRWRARRRPPPGRRCRRAGSGAPTCVRGVHGIREDRRHGPTEQALGCSTTVTSAPHPRATGRHLQADEPTADDDDLRPARSAERAGRRRPPSARVHAPRSPPSTASARLAPPVVRASREKRIERPAAVVA